MSNRRLAAILAACVAIGAIGLAAGSTRAQPLPESVTVSLVQGWNLVGWTGDDTPILAATADIANRFNDLRSVDPESGTILRFRDGIASHENTLTQLRYGMGVWVLVGEPTTWTHAPRAPSTTVALEPGFNLVAWLGDDDTPIAAALAPLGAAVLTAHTWDSAGQRFRRHLDTGATAFLNESVNLMRGDALWLEMAAAADWAQATPGADAVSAVVDAGGAVLNHADGVSVDVPPGALPVGTPMSLFRIQTPPNLPAHVNWVGQTYEISAGAVLDGFATLRVPVPNGVDPAGLDLFRLGAGNRPFPQGAALENGALVAQTASFSLAGVGASNNRVSIIGPQLVFGGNTVEYLIGDAALADNPNMIAKWEFENDDPGSPIFSQKLSFSFSRSRMVTFKAGATGSGTIRVKLAASPFTASGQLAVQVTTNGPAVEISAPILDGASQQIGDSIDFSFTAFGGTPPYDFEIDFDEGDPLVECLDCTSTISRSNIWETPGLKTVTVVVTDANLQFATARYSVAVAPSSLSCKFTAKSDQIVPADTPAEFQVAISGGAPGYTVDWLLTSFSSVGGPQPDPQFKGDAGKVDHVIRTFDWRPSGAGTYDFVAVVSDALGAECRRSIQVRVLPFGITLINPPVGAQKGAPFTIAGTLSGVTGSCFIRFEDDDGSLIGVVVTSTATFELPGITLDRPGTHELTVVAACLGVKTSVKHLIQVLNGQAMWVRGFPVANPGGLPLLVSNTLGSYERCRILLPDQFAYSLLTKVNGVTDPTANLEFAFSFEEPPLQVVPGTPIDLNLSGEVTGFSNGSRAEFVSLSYTGTLTTSSQEAVVKLAGGALANPAFGVTKDARTATAAFPATGVGGDAGFIDITVAATARGCRIRWPYVRILASTQPALP